VSGLTYQMQSVGGGLLAHSDCIIIIFQWMNGTSIPYRAISHLRPGNSERRLSVTESSCSMDESGDTMLGWTTDALNIKMRDR
jgi:hypothetical protein